MLPKIVPGVEVTVTKLADGSAHLLLRGVTYYIPPEALAATMAYLKHIGIIQGGAQA